MNPLPLTESGETRTSPDMEPAGVNAPRTRRPAPASNCERCGREKRPYKNRHPGKPFSLRCPTCSQGNRRVERKAKRAYNRRWEDHNPEKRSAHKAVERALAKGTLVRQPCERCAATIGVHAHHDDYAKPLDVRWLCPIHHRDRHVELEATKFAPLPSGESEALPGHSSLNSGPSSGGPAFSGAPG